ncbi:Uncharacterised protein [Mycobacteroides abscessus subsp. abscessus]|uniref:hypothetical protein n=1 Tax=Mycobacteroides abscessus TaxID=36809 RepID=UPI00092AAA72|nr:hypothetical protein [Mycobacteroides abscessus]SIH19534.1 Uncharacterised protein [Mycobacteroides abscessus subsp. abscessus]
MWGCEQVCGALRGALFGLVVFASASIGAIPDAGAAPSIPDIDSLIDDSGPLPSRVEDLNALPALWFKTATGLTCHQRTSKVTHQISCAGLLPGQPEGTHIADLQSAYSSGLGPAQFVAKTSDEFFGGPPPLDPVPLSVGHKIVFWNFPGTESLACGVPVSADLVCVLKAPREIGPRKGPPVTHGFVIGAPASRVF